MGEMTREEQGIVCDVAGEPEYFVDLVAGDATSGEMVGGWSASGVGADETLSPSDADIFVGDLKRAQTEHAGT